MNFLSDLGLSGRKRRRVLPAKVASREDPTWTPEAAKDPVAFAVWVGQQPSPTTREEAIEFWAKVTAAAAKTDPKIRVAVKTQQEFADIIAAFKSGDPKAADAMRSKLINESAPPALLGKLASSSVLIARMRAIKPAVATSDQKPRGVRGSKGSQGSAGPSSSPIRANTGLKPHNDFSIFTPFDPGMVTPNWQTLGPQASYDTSHQTTGLISNPGKPVSAFDAALTNALKNTHNFQPIAPQQIPSFGTPTWDSGGNQSSYTPSWQMNGLDVLGTTNLDSKKLALILLGAFVLYKCVKGGSR